MNITRRNLLRWSTITTGGIVFGTALPACGGGGGGGGGGSSANSATAAVASAPPAFTASLAASRLSGVAPLYVNFDATSTTHPQIANPTHDLFYSWIFGDTSAGVWANGVQSAGLTSKNAAFGPVSGHVFETPGTYVVNLIVMDGVNTVSKSVTVTVQDPNVVYAGANTICISSSGNFIGAPSGAMQIHTAGNTNMYAAFNTYKASNKRILFCKADSWTCSAQMALNNLSNMTIAGYGTGVAATFGTGTMVSVTPSAFGGAMGASMFLVNLGNSDIRICNIRIDSTPDVFASSVNSTMSGMLYYKVEIRGCAQGWNVLASQNPTSVVPDQVCLYECLVDDLYGYAGVDTPTALASGAVGTPGVFTSVAHPFKVNYKVRLDGTPPAPLLTGTDYYVTAAGLTANTFTLSTTYGGSAVAVTGVGTCTVRAQNLGGGISAYVGMTRGGIMGCNFDSCNHGEHSLRIPYIDRGHINNNRVARPNQGKSVIKIHSVIHAYFPVWSEKFVVSCNEIDMRGGYSYDGTTITITGDSAIAIGSGGNDGVGGEWVRNGIVENNLTHGCLGNPKSSLVFAKIACPNMTVRNNIADFSVGDRTSSVTGLYPYTTVSMVTIDAGPVEITTGVRVYNNTLYSNLANAEAVQFVRTFGIVDGIKIKNNLWYLPNRLENFQYGVIYNNGGLATNIDATNNTSSHLANPHFANLPPMAVADWRPTSGYALNSGTTVPVLRDINNNSRVGSTYDMGAVLP